MARSKVSSEEILQNLDVRNKKQHYLSLLFHDKEFIADITDFKFLLHKAYSPRQLSAGYDLVFLIKMGVPISPLHVSHLKSLAKKYHVVTTTIVRYMDGHYRDDSVINLIYHQIQTKSGKIVMTLSPDINQKQFRSIWPKVELAKEMIIGNNIKTRNRSPANYELIYYVAKSIDKGLSWDEIADLYNFEKLPGYSNSTNDRAYTSKELSDYYNKYKFF
jgi:hypothetical protein